MDKQNTTDIKQILQSTIGENVLTEETLKSIEDLFNESVNNKVKQHVDVALAEQDEIYSNKLHTFIEQLDASHAAKLQQIVEQIDNNNYQKLLKVKQLYTENFDKYGKDLKKFKDNLISTVQLFIEKKINKLVPVESINEAVKNKKYGILIEQFRDLLSIDKASENNAIREGINEAHQTIENLKQANTQILTENANLKARISNNERDILLENKLKEIDNDLSRKTLQKMFKNKSIEIINENFDYSAELLDSKAKKEKQQIAENIINEKSNNGEFIKQINENTDNSAKKSIYQEYAELCK